MNGGGGNRMGAAMAGLMAVRCGRHLVVLPLLASGALTGLAGAFTGQAALAAGGGMLVLAGVVGCCQVQGAVG